MKKYILIASIACILHSGGFTQSANSLWIDSLKNELISLSGREKVDCINHLADAFRTNGPNFALDSIRKYATVALNESLKIGYKEGEAFSRLNLGEEGIQQALSIGRSIENPKIIGRAYLYQSYNARKNEDYIELLKNSISYFKQANDPEGVLEASIRLCTALTTKGVYDEGFTYCDKCTELEKNANLTPWGNEMMLWYFQNMATLYQNAGNYKVSLDYYFQGNQYSQKNKLTWNLDLNIAGVYTQMGKLDSALYYFNRFEGNANTYVINSKPYWSTTLAKIYLGSNQPEKALSISQEGIMFFKNKNPKGFFMSEHLLCAAEAETDLKNYKNALKLAKEGIKLAEEMSLTRTVMLAYKLTSDIYHKIGDNTNAYSYLKKHILLRDSILNYQSIFMLNELRHKAENERKLSEIKLLNKNNELKSLQIKKQTSQRNFLIAGILLLLILGFIVIRSLQLKRKAQKTDLAKKMTDLEMKALRAQMNPHFIFNCLSSINRIIMKNDSHAASDYLTRFSRLVRMVLINSRKQFISLEEELQMLRLYLDMERLRFKDSFEYKIIFSNTIDEGAVLVPPLILQPFCENAIWHGLMQKEGPGLLTVELSIRDNVLNCSITDNGIGRAKARELKSRSAENKKSMGLAITAERLALLNQEKELQTIFNIEDLTDENGAAKGTKVNLTMIYKEPVEVLN